MPRLGGYGSESSSELEVWTRELYREGELLRTDRFASPAAGMPVNSAEGVESYGVRAGQVQTRELAPLPPRSNMASASESYGAYVANELNGLFGSVERNLDGYAEDPNTSAGMRFVAAMVKNPAQWFGDAVKGTWAIGAYVGDGEFRSEVNGAVGQFLSNDPLTCPLPAVPT